MRFREAPLPTARRPPCPPTPRRGGGLSSTTSARSTAAPLPSRSTSTPTHPSSPPPSPEGGGRPPESFDLGAIVDPDLEVDLQEQAQAFNAVIAEAAERPEIRGRYARRYNPRAGVRALSASVNG